MRFACVNDLGKNTDTQKLRNDLFSHAVGLENPASKKTFLCFNATFVCNV